MDQQDTLLRLIGLIYDAVVDPELWPDFLKEVSVAMGGGMTCLTLQHPGQDLLPVTVCHGVEDSAVRAYEDYFYHIDPIQDFIKDDDEGMASFGEAHVPHNVLVKTEVYNDWYRPNRLLPGSIGGTVERVQNIPSVFGLYRTEETREYGREEIDLFQALMPHLKRALQLRRRLNQHASQLSSLLAVLDQLAFGVVLLDRGGRVEAANRAAMDLARQGDGIFLSRGELRGNRPSESAALRRCVLEAARAASGDGMIPGGVVVIPRSPPSRPLELLVSPLRIPECDEKLGRVAVAVFINDPDVSGEASPELLRDLYGLTSSEAAVAARLGRGERLNEAAEALGISVNTAKTRLQEVFAKTGTHRQAELVSLITSHPSRIRADS